MFTKELETEFKVVKDKRRLNSRKTDSSLNTRYASWKWALLKKWSDSVGEEIWGRFLEKFRKWRHILENLDTFQSKARTI